MTDIPTFLRQVRSLEQQIEIASDEIQSYLRLIQEELQARGFGKAPCVDLDAHECQTSPTGRCVYDDEEDPAHDECLFCHEPYERK